MRYRYLKEHPVSVKVQDVNTSFGVIQFNLN